MSGRAESRRGPPLEEGGRAFGMRPGVALDSGDRPKELVPESTATAHANRVVGWRWNHAMGLIKIIGSVNGKNVELLVFRFMTF